MAKRTRRLSVGQTTGGVLFGFEQRVLRATPPPRELVQHARPDLPVAAGDETLVAISLPDPDPDPLPVHQPRGEDPTTNDDADAR